MDMPAPTRITINPTGASLAADVSGVDLSRPVDAQTFKQIEDAWHAHLVLRFRGQQLDDPRFLAFARLFGELDKAPIHAGQQVADPFPEITVMSNIKVDGKPIGNLGHYEAEWHTDMSYNELAPIGSLLYAIEVPPAGGNTGFSNMYAACDDLPAGLLGEIGVVPLAVTTSLNINFLRRPVQRDVIGEARPLKVGRRLAAGEVTLFSDGDPEPVAHVTSTYSIPPHPHGGGATGRSD